MTCVVVRRVNPNPGKKCGARTKAAQTYREAGTPCQFPAGYNTDHLGFGVCYLHGGRGSARIPAYREQLEFEMKKLYQEFNKGPVTDVAASLAEIVGELIAFKDAIAHRLAEMQEDDQLDDIMADPKKKEVMVLYERALERCAKLLADATKLGILNRSITIEQQQAEFVKKAVLLALKARGYDTDELLLVEIGNQLKEMQALPAPRESSG